MAEPKVIGNSMGVLLPREVLSRRGVHKGDTVFATDEADGFAR